MVISGLAEPREQQDGGTIEINLSRASRDSRIAIHLELHFSLANIKFASMQASETIRVLRRSPVCIKGRPSLL